MEIAKTRRQRETEKRHAAVLGMYKAMSGEPATQWAKVRTIANRFHLTPQGVAKILKRYDLYDQHRTASEPARQV